MALNNLTRITNSGFGTDASINTTGIVTAASFSGDGSALTGVVGSGSGLVIQEEGSNVGTAQTINFVGTGVTATMSGAVATVEISATGGSGGGLSNIVEDPTPQLGGNLDVNGRDITGTGDINLTGVVTATSLTGNVTGTATTATNLANAANITTGTISNDRLPATITSNITGNVTGDVTGDVTGTATTATNVTVADESSDTSCFLLYSTEATGNIAPKTGSNLTFNSSTGGLTAGSFIGDGSGLTGITASGSGVIIQDDGTLVGTAGTIDFGTNVSVSPISAGVVTVTAAAGSIPGISTAATTELTHLSVAGVSTFTGAIDANGDLDVDGVSTFAGITTVTGETFFTKQLDASGISTFRSDVDVVNGSIKLKTPTDNNVFNISYSAANDDVTFGFDQTGGTGGSEVQFRLKDNAAFKIRNSTTAGTIAKFTADGNNELYYDDSKKFETTNTGAVVTGILTATTFSGSGASLTTLNASELDSGTIPDNRFPATLPAVSGANLTNLPASGISTAFTNVQATWSVGGDTSGYTFTGPGQDGAEQNPNIYLVRGQRYRFINTTGSSHPFEIRVSNGGSAYTDGITGSQSGTQEFNVQHDAPARLFYQCTVHSGMVGNIYISDYPRVLLEDDVATTNQTSKEYDGIPSWVTKITLLFDRVSTTGGSELLVQLGTSGGAITSNYDSSSSNSSGGTLETSTAGFVLYVNASSSALTGKMEIQRAGTSNKWISAHTMKHSDNTRDGAGVLTTYSGTIDRVVVTTEGGSNTFDGGAITVYYGV